METTPFRRGPRGRFAWLGALGLLAALGLGWVVMALWNAVLVPVLPVGHLGYWQGLGLLVLCRLLFGRWGGGRPGAGRQGRPGFAKWQRLSPAEREQFRQRMRAHRFGPPPGEEAPAGRAEA